MISRIHTYAGLLTLANVALYAVVGIAALFETRRAQAPEVWDQAFARTAGATDRETAARVVRLLGLSLATPVHDFNIRRDAGGLVLDFYHANGRHRITVLENHIRVERTRAGLGRYLSTLHVTTAAFRSGDWRMQVWAWWNELAMWSLVAMTASGVWMWLARRRVKGATRLAHRYAAVAMLSLLAIYEASAVQMAHRTWPKAGAWLERVHRMYGVSFAPVLGIGLAVLGASGVYLWWTLRRDRWAGALLLAAGCAMTCVLAVWMRWA